MEKTQLSSEMIYHRRALILKILMGCHWMGVCLLEEGNCWGFMHGETAGGNETDVELELKATFSVPLGEVVM
jgi:hypothetical protein